VYPESLCESEGECLGGGINGGVFFVIKRSEESPLPANLLATGLPRNYLADRAAIASDEINPGKNENVQCLSGSWLWNLKHWLQQFLGGLETFYLATAARDRSRWAFFLITC
jgi:hypothetical protein